VTGSEPKTAHNWFHLYVVILPDGSYIGVAHDPRARFKQHCVQNRTLRKWIKMWGRDNVSFRVLVSGGRDYIYALESEAIRVFKTREPLGYNVASGGFGGRNPLPSTRTKISVGRQGIVFSPTHLKNLSVSHMGHLATAETKAKMSATRKNRPWSAARRAVDKRGLIV